MTDGDSIQSTPRNNVDSEGLAFGDVVGGVKAPVLDTVPFGMLNYRIPDFDYQKYPIAPIPFENYHLGTFNGYYGLPNDFDIGRRNEHFASLSGNSTVDGDSITEEEEPLGPDGSIPPPNKRDPIYTAVSGLKWKAKSKKWVVRWDNPNTSRRVYKYFSGTRYGFLGAHKRAKYYLEFLNASVGKCEAPSINNPFCRRTEGPPKGKTNKGLLKRLESKRTNNNFNGATNGFVSGGGAIFGGAMNNQQHRCGTLPMDPYIHYYYSQDPNGNMCNGNFVSNNVAPLNGYENANGVGVNNDDDNNGEYTLANENNNAKDSILNGSNINGIGNGDVENCNNAEPYYGNSRNTAWVLDKPSHVTQLQLQQKEEAEEKERQRDYFGCT